MLLKKIIFTTLVSLALTLSVSASADLDDSLPFLWPLPAQFTSGNDTLSVDPALSLSVSGKGGHSTIVREAFDRYRKIIFKHSFNGFSVFRGIRSGFDIGKLNIVVHSESEEVGFFCFWYMFIIFAAKFDVFGFLFVFLCV